VIFFPTIKEESSGKSLCFGDKLFGFVFDDFILFVLSASSRVFYCHGCN